MAQSVYRANLSAADFPLVTSFQGRTSIASGIDQNFNRQLVSRQDKDKDVGIPQPLYMHNVMPTSSGLQSVGFELKNAAPTTPDTTNEIDNIYELRDAQGRRAYYTHTKTGYDWLLISGSGVWERINAVPTYPNTIVSVGFVAGITYIYLSNVGCFYFDFDTKVMVSSPLAGLTPSTILGITAVQGYLIAYSVDTVSWSSTISASDFVPSLSTGAGGGSVEGVSGKIVTCQPAPLGFIIYTQSNCVLAQYSGNIRYPFNFRAIVGGGGLSDPALVVNSADAGDLYAYTTSGLQSISGIKANTVFPEITDFLAGQVFEDFDVVTRKLIRTQLSVILKKKLSYISDRYLIISYGINELTHAIVYDTALLRFGKIKYTHVAAFEYQILSTEVIETPKKSLAFLSANGDIYTVDFSQSANVTDSVFILGKVQYTRQRLLTLDTIEIENVSPDSSLAVYDLVALDGKTYSEIPTTKLVSESFVEDSLVRKYGLRATAINHSILFIGRFFATTIILTFHNSGNR
jgi:hypothetical protein